jgi:TPR repeat protein
MKKTCLAILLTITVSVMLFAQVNLTGSEQKLVDDMKVRANSGEAASQYQLGKMYYEGKDVPQNLKEAVRMFQLAADKGYPEALVAMGKCYMNGEGVPQDSKQAMKYFNQAALKESPAAEYQIGVMHYAGEGVPVNYEEGAKWFIKAADGGLVEAQENLGFCYYEGSGVKMNVSESYFWLKLASVRCTPDKTAEYTKAMEIKRAELSQSEIDKQDARVETWLKAHNEK